MENQATGETFSCNGMMFERVRDGGVKPLNGLARRWRHEPAGNCLQECICGEWHDDDIENAEYDNAYKSALRALVGPPPWETQAPAAVASSLPAPNDYRSRIKSIGEHLASLSDEAEHGFAEFRELNYRATQMQGEIDGLRAEMTQWVSEHAAMKGAMVAAQSRLLAIHTAAEKAERGAGTVPREETIRAAADVFRVIFADAEHGVNIPEVLECPYGEPYHAHGDGCPCCMEVEDWAGDIADAVMVMAEESNMVDREEIRQVIFRCLQERRVYPRSKSTRVTPDHELAEPIVSEVCGMVDFDRFDVEPDTVRAQAIVNQSTTLEDFSNAVAWAREVTEEILAATHEDADMEDYGSIKGILLRHLERVIPMRRTSNEVENQEVPSATVAEWNRMREYMQGRETGGITEERVREIANEVFESRLNKARTAVAT